MKQCGDTNNYRHYICVIKKQAAVTTCQRNTIEKSLSQNKVNKKYKKELFENQDFSDYKTNFLASCC